MSLRRSVPIQPYTSRQQVKTKRSAEKKTMLAHLVLELQDEGVPALEPRLEPRQLRAEGHRVLVVAPLEAGLEQRHARAQRHRVVVVTHLRRRTK